MNDQARNTNTIDSLMEFLDRVDPKGRQQIARELAQAGIAAGVQTATTDLAEPTLSPPIAPDAASKLRKTALLKLAVTTLTNVIDRFQPLKSEIQKRLRRVEGMKLLSAIITTLLSSSVVASLGLGGEKNWSLALGFLALFASVLTLIATRLEGGANISEEFGEVSAKCEAAVQLRDRLTAYSDAPDLFEDVEDRLKEAESLSLFLTDKIARWNLPTAPPT